MIRNSLRARLGLGLLFSLAILFAGLWVIVDVSVHRLLEAQMAGRLAHDGENLLGGLRFDGQGRPVLDKRRIQGIYQQPLSGHYFLVESGGVRLRSRSLWDAELSLPTLPVGESRQLHVTGPKGQPLLLWIGAFHKQGHDVRIGVAEELAGLETGIRRFHWHLLGWASAMALLLLLLQQYIVHRSLRSVALATREVSRLERGELAALREDVPAEIRPLVQAINTLLERQRLRLIRSREALGNLAHAIKTPLTLLLQLGHERIRDPEARRQFDEYGQRIREQTDTTLRRARLAGDSLGTRRFRLDDDLPDLLDSLQRLYPDRKLAIDTRFPAGLTLPLEQQDGMELLGNLLDNAWKWARQRIRLTIETGDKDLRIRIEDDGPGIAPEQQASLLRRGRRQDENRPGHGIGLSLVRGLVEDFGGTLHLATSATLGGLRVDVHLPQSPFAAGNDAPAD